MKLNRRTLRSGSVSVAGREMGCKNAVSHLWAGAGRGLGCRRRTEVGWGGAGGAGLARKREAVHEKQVRHTPGECFLSLRTSVR